MSQGTNNGAGEQQPQAGQANGAEGGQQAAAGEAAAQQAAAAQHAAGGGAEGGKGGKDQLLADLARERDKRQELEKTVANIQQASKQQMAALATAFGLDPDKGGEQNAAEALAEQVKSLQEKFAATERKAAILELAARPGEDADGKPLPAIPAEYHHLLTATDPEGLAAQAKSVAALVAATGAAQQNPSFAASAGQGQNGGAGDETSLTAQLAAAEKELQGKTPGTPEHRAVQKRLMSLKSQQLYAASLQQS